MRPKSCLPNGYVGTAYSQMINATLATNIPRCREGLAQARPYSDLPDMVVAGGFRS